MNPTQDMNSMQGMNPIQALMDPTQALRDKKVQARAAAPMPEEQIHAAVMELMKAHVRPELSSLEKQTQYLRMRETDFYFRGIQNLEVVTRGSTIDFQPLVPAAAQEDDYRVNVIRAYGRKFVPAIGTRPWHNAKVVPEDAANETDRQAARHAEKLILWCKQIWNIRKLSLQIPYHQYKDGTVFAHLAYVADAATFGVAEVPETQMVEKELEPERWECGVCGEVDPNPPVDEFDGLRSCQKCGMAMDESSFRTRETAQVPEVVGTKVYPNAGPTVRLYTGYEVTIPFFSREIERVPFLVLEYREHRSELYRVFGDELRKKMQNVPSGGTDSQLGNEYRDSKISPSGTPSATQPGSHWEYRATWIQPWMYELIDDERVRAELKTRYPRGMKVSEVEGVIVRLEDRSLGAEWVAIPPETAEYLYSDPYAYSLLELQELINEFWTVAVAFSKRKLPSVVAHPDMGLGSRIKNSNGLPMEIIEAEAGFGRSINDNMGIIPTPQGEAGQFTGLMNMCREFIELISGLRPEVHGAGEKQATAEAARNALNQALAMLAPNGELAAQGYAELYRKALNLILENATGKIRVSVDGGDGSRVTEMVDIEELKQGRYMIESEAGVPMSWAERRTQLDSIVTQNPALAQAIGIDNPVNMPVVRDYMLPGMNELRVPNEDMRAKVLSTIQSLLKAEPIMAGDGAMEPSILPEPFVDSPDMANIVRLWCLSQAGITAKERMTAGYRNVVLYGQRLEMLGASIPGPAAPGEATDGPMPPGAGAPSPNPGAGPPPALPPTGAPAAVPAL